ncbi:MAG TPA: periplasmic heavy metal sensor [Stellaceae bacterium]|nr:periplasmic heavy metal sensor [Stellaceae bacterium]
MSAAVEADRPARRRGRLVWVALILSLTLNVFFIGGLVWSKVARERIETPAERFQQLGRELNLSSAQQADLRQFVRTIRLRARLLQESNGPLLERTWQEVAKPSPDQAEFARLTGQAAQNREAFQKDMSAALATFIAALTPEQRAQLAGIAAQPRDQISRRLRWLIVP